MGDPFGWAGQDRHEQTGANGTRTPGRRLGVGTARLPGVHFMIGNDTPTRPNQIPLPTTSPEFQDAHLASIRGTAGGSDLDFRVIMPGGAEARRSCWSVQL